MRNHAFARLPNDLHGLFAWCLPEHADGGECEGSSLTLVLSLGLADDIGGILCSIHGSIGVGRGKIDRVVPWQDLTHLLLTTMVESIYHVEPVPVSLVGETESIVQAKISLNIFALMPNIS